MKTRSHILVGTAIALALGLSLDLIRKDAEMAPEPLAAAPVSVAADTQTYFEPKLGGVNLDVRMMGHMRASPVRTAERFCRDKGYTSVADLTVRASTATRTIADGAVQRRPGLSNQAFAMIRCANHPANLSSTG